MKPLMLIQPNSKKIKGFTLIEMVMVMVLLGVMAVGIGSFISLATQTYVNVSARDELIASARFAIERMNREIRNAVPNSIRIADSANIQCIEFVPILASTTYIDIPVAPEPNLNEISVIPFVGEDGNDYSCGPTCLDLVTVYPLTTTDIYNQSFIGIGKSFRVNSFTPTAGVNEWTIPLAPPLVGSGILFDADSPTKRAYFFRDPVSYCVNNQHELIRYSGHGYNSTPLTIPTGASSLMAENLMSPAPPTSKIPFSITNATLTRNAIVQISLGFERDGEIIVFDHEIHVANVP
ncbi:PilW family protein [Colwelliaceae bacterium 6471]